MARKGKTSSWMQALADTGLTVKSARDALQVKGWLDTGNYALNWAISGRLLQGYPLGHCGELFGDPGTGKSFLAARALAMAQQAQGVALLDDSEHAYNMEHAGKLGVDVEALAYFTSRTVDEHLNVATGFVKAFAQMQPPGPGVLVCDSLAQLSTKHELETRLDKRDMSKAAELKAFYRIVGGDMFELPMVHIATNHKIAAIGNMYQKSTTPGGGGPKFMASFRLDLRAISKIKLGTEYIGTICRVVVDKNRIVAPWKEVRLAIPFYQPISRASGLIPLLADLGVVKINGNFLFFRGEKIGRSYKSKERFLEQDEIGEQILDTYPELLEEVDKELATSPRAPKAAVAAVEDEEEGDGEGDE